MNPKKKNTRDENDEVEELLRAAEDATLLKLNLNSHNVHASLSDLDPDLDQRFRVLKSGSKSKAKQQSVAKKSPTPKSETVNKCVEDDDLLARFAALKASVPKPSSSSNVGVETSDTFFGVELGDGCLGGKVNVDDEDEVDKVIRWAMDAARLDPSPSSDDEDTNNDDDFEDDEKSDTDAENSQQSTKRK